MPARDRTAPDRLLGPGRCYIDRTGPLPACVKPASGGGLRGAPAAVCREASAGRAGRQADAEGEPAAAPGVLAAPARSAGPGRAGSFRAGPACRAALPGHRIRRRPGSGSQFRGRVQALARAHLSGSQRALRRAGLWAGGVGRRAGFRVGSWRGEKRARRRREGAGRDGDAGRLVHVRARARTHTHAQLRGASPAAGARAIARE